MQTEHEVTASLQYLVNQVVNRGITRIKRHKLVEEIITTLLSFIPEPKQKLVVIDTEACRFTITMPDTKHITIEGNEEVSDTLRLEIQKDNSVLLNGSTLEHTRLVVSLTSLLLKNSLDPNTAVVEVFTKS